MERQNQFHSPPENANRTRPPVAATKLSDDKLSPHRQEISVQAVAGGPQTPSLTPATAIASTAAKHRREEATEDWLSKLIEHLWPKIRKTSEDLAWETVPASLHDTKPSWVHSLSLNKFQMGHKEPDLRRVRCYVDEEDVMDDVFVEMDLEWESKIDVEIKLEVFSKNLSSLVPSIIENQLAKLFTMVVGVENVSVKGTLQLAMRPLYYRVPIVGAVQVGFTQMPKFDFEPTIAGGPLGSALNALLPSVKSWLKTTVNEAIWMPYVLPDHYFYPLDPGAPDLQRPVGVVHLRIVEACNVPRMDLFGSSDTFVEAYIRHSQRNITAVCSGKHPKWENEVFVMPLHSIEHQRLRFILSDQDVIANDEIGRCELNFRSHGVPENETRDVWLDVVNEGEEEEQAAKHGERGVQLRKRDRALRAVVKPSGCGSKKTCKLHVRVKWRRWNDEETEFIKDATRRGVRAALGSPRGRGLDPELREMMLSGAVHVTLQKCKKLDVHGLLWRPSIKMVLTVAHLPPVETPPFKVSRHGNADLTGAPLQVNVPGNIADQENAVVKIELQEVGFLSGNDIVGVFKIPLKELQEKECIQGERKLKSEDEDDDDDEMGGGHAGKAKFEIRWVGTFT